MNEFDVAISSKVVARYDVPAVVAVMTFSAFTDVECKLNL
jgi:hypothetical protein